MTRLKPQFTYTFERPLHVQLLASRPDLIVGADASPIVVIKPSLSTSTRQPIITPPLVKIARLWCSAPKGPQGLNSDGSLDQSKTDPNSRPIQSRPEQAGDAHLDDIERLNEKIASHMSRLETVTFDEARQMARDFFMLTKKVCVGLVQRVLNGENPEVINDIIENSFAYSPYGMGPIRILETNFRDYWTALMINVPHFKDEFSWGLEYQHMSGRYMVSFGGMGSDLVQNKSEAPLQYKSLVDWHQRRNITQHLHHVPRYARESLDALNAQRIKIIIASDLPKNEIEPEEKWDIMEASERFMRFGISQLTDVNVRYDQETGEIVLQTKTSAEQDVSFEIPDFETLQTKVFHSNGVTELRLKLKSLA